MSYPLFRDNSVRISVFSIFLSLSSHSVTECYTPSSYHTFSILEHYMAYPTVTVETLYTLVNGKRVTTSKNLAALARLPHPLIVRIITENLPALEKMGGLEFCERIQVNSKNEEVRYDYYNLNEFQVYLISMFVFRLTPLRVQCVEYLWDLYSSCQE